MPSLTFVMPHWLYWSGLILFPLAAMYLAKRQDESEKDPTKPSLSIAYMLLICGGFVGLHRFYLRAWKVTPVLIGLFIAVLLGNIEVKEIRVTASNAKNDILGAAFDIENYQKAVSENKEGAQQKLQEAQTRLENVKASSADLEEQLVFWDRFSGIAGLLILLILLMDAYLLKGMRDRCEAYETKIGFKVREVHNPRDFEPEDPTIHVHTPVTDTIDKISGVAGNFVAYWSIIAVYVYYYEVIARYVFNSPTNWAHEGMFLMFGMQYLLSGAYALREDAHVRVDVLYLYLSDRNKVKVDLVTSVFFYLFSTALMVSGFIFAMDAASVLEVSFTEWAIQYWPVKFSIALGGLLLLLQGTAKVIKDVALLTRKEA